jgi:hypothetical protein
MKEMEKTKKKMERKSEIRKRPEGTYSAQLPNRPKAHPGKLPNWYPPLTSTR